MNSRVFKASDLVRVGPPRNPRDISFVIPGATVWMASGGPAMRVLSVCEGLSTVEWNQNGRVEWMMIPAACLTPEPTPIL